MQGTRSAHLSDTLLTWLGGIPVISILRGVRPSEALEVGGSLVASGIRVIEVPLNSPDPFDSIGQLADAYSGRALVGAGTVLTSNDVRTLASVGGRIAVAPNTDIEMIRASLDAGLVPVPGVFSPTDAFAALRAGARILKLFPASRLGPSWVRDLKAVLPPDAAIVPVGGIDRHTVLGWLEAGAHGVGVGSAIYQPGDAPADVAKKAAALARIVGCHDAGKKKRISQGRA